MEEKNFDEFSETNENIDNKIEDNITGELSRENSPFETTQREEIPQSAPKAEQTVDSGEYRYKPPYAGYGANIPGPQPRFNPYAYNQYPPQTPPTPPVKTKKKKKIEGRRFSSGAVALIVVACLFISFGAGFGGAYLANALFGAELNNGADQLVGGNNVVETEDGAMVIYKSVTVGDAEGNEIKGDLTVTQVAENVADSVVEITTEYTTSYGFYQYVTGGAGSGVIITEDGYIVTNNHVIVDDSGEIAETIIVRLRNGVEYNAVCIGTDSESDIAVLKIEENDLRCAVIGDSTTLSVGDGVVAVGNPLGELGGTVTDGIISATSREIDVDGTKMTLLQTNVAINPGNSGGGLFNMRGELVGVVNAKSSGTGIEGLGFAIPVNDAMKVIEELRTHGYVTGRTYIGVQFVDVTDAFQAYQYFKSKSTGVYVYDTEEGYNDEALKYGDRVIAINDIEISSFEDVKEIIRASEVGDVLEFSVYRDGKLKRVDVKCFEYMPENVDFE